MLTGDGLTKLEPQQTATLVHLGIQTLAQMTKHVLKTVPLMELIVLTGKVPMESNQLLTLSNLDL